MKSHLSYRVKNLHTLFAWLVKDWIKDWLVQISTYVTGSLLQEPILSPTLRVSSFISRLLWTIFTGTIISSKFIYLFNYLFIYLFCVLSITLEIPWRSKAITIFLKRWQVAWLKIGIGIIISLNGGSGDNTVWSQFTMSDAMS